MVGAEPGVALDAQEACMQLYPDVFALRSPLFVNSGSDGGGHGTGTEAAYAFGLYGWRVVSRIGVACDLNQIAIVEVDSWVGTADINAAALCLDHHEPVRSVEKDNCSFDANGEFLRRLLS